MQAIRGLVGEVAEADPAVAVGVISSCKAEDSIPYRTACRALGVSESWYYKWRDRPPTARAVRRQHLAEEIEEIFHDSGGTYGLPKVFIELVRRGWRVSVNTVAKAMAELGLAGRKVRRRRSLTRPGKRLAAQDFGRRDFSAEELDLVWAGDMTEIDTGEGLDQDRHLDHRLLQRQAATQRMQVQEPDRLRTRLPSHPRRGTSRIDRLHTARGLTAGSPKRRRRPRRRTSSSRTRRIAVGRGTSTIVTGCE
ncbi:IS3 family transposase [Streptomyces sp. NPDC058457]|uniref:IS3 family transposase n=1 Tax=Streptomyces sp. NPDC058457 TaxID=3346507 RepID=UPI00366817DA